MNEQNILQCKNRQEFRTWLMEIAKAHGKTVGQVILR